MTINQILKQYWGFSNFRPLQQDIINGILQGNDVFALLPTGGGKSVCFQVPAMAKGGICLVISPLIALIKDQVLNLKNKGIPALALYSGMSFLEIKKTLQNAAYGNYKFLYLSPERLETKLFLEFLPNINISLIAVDEAHCISQWGYDFRPPYLRIANLREWVPNVPVLALTASATKMVQKDICEKLLFNKTSLHFKQSFERENLSYSVFNPSSKQNKLLQILKNVNGAAIVYCKSRKQTKEIADLLNTNNFYAEYYHAGLNYEERNKKQENWIANKTRVIVCTNAFGMGIDKPDVRLVVHYDVPDCLENYYQEAGRAGRDGKKSYAILLYSNNDVENLQQQSNLRFPKEGEIKSIYTSLMNYLQIPAGYGENLNFDFNIAAFAKAFKLNILAATYAIKVLEQEGVLSLSELFFKPSTLVFTINKTDLTEFINTHPLLEDIIKGMLRCYEGIFDYETTIYETQLAQFIKKNITQIKIDLKHLSDIGIIAYTPQKDTPQITLLQNRMYSDSYTLNIKNHLQRKKIFDSRIAEMINYIKTTTTCRSEIIATYFNVTINKLCGICDNCINEKELTITKEEFDDISNNLLTCIKREAVSLQDFLNSYSNIKKEKIWKVINYLQAENKIKVNKEGSIYK